MDELKSLGKNTNYTFGYTPEILESFENMHPERDYMVTLMDPKYIEVWGKLSTSWWSKH